MACKTAQLFGGGRSAFIGHGRPPLVSRRCFFLRATVLSVAGLLLAAGPLALFFGLVQPTGPGRALFWLHDEIYLLLRGWLWNVWFPWGLAIWFPFLGIAFLALVETVTGASPMRSLQRRMIRRLALQPFGPTLLSAWHRLAGGGRIRARFIEMSVASLTEERLERLRQRHLKGTRTAGSDVSLIRLVTLNLRLRGRFALDNENAGLACMALDALLLLSWKADDLGKRALPKRLADLVELIEGFVSRAAERGDPSEPAAQSERSSPGWLMADAAELCAAYFALLRGQDTPGREWIAMAFADRRLSVAAVAAQVEWPYHGGTAMPQVERKLELAAGATTLILSACVGIAWQRPEFADEVASLAEEVDRLRFAVSWRDRPPHDTPRLLVEAFARAGDMIDLSLHAALLEMCRATEAVAIGSLPSSILEGRFQSWATWRERGDLWRAIGPGETL